MAWEVSFTYALGDIRPINQGSGTLNRHPGEERWHKSEGLFQAARQIRQLRRRARRNLLEALKGGSYLLDQSVQDVRVLHQVIDGVIQPQGWRLITRYQQLASDLLEVAELLTLGNFTILWNQSFDEIKVFYGALAPDASFQLLAAVGSDV